ncbi:MFS transporter [Alsobacter metallidurans]|uniref:MFS transporter n=1 Tax=Alsobacter metallidurans TaxID=340221 RepID=UPI00166A1175|nr:MFS transporter [Alsobacter metallidurans]
MNFLLADVRGGLGPYVGVFLITQAGWDQATLGAVLTLSGLVGIAVHAPIGALIDASRAKRAILVTAIVLLAISSLAIISAPTVPVVFAADVTMAALGAVFAPVVAAITLGLTPTAALAARFGRNAAFDKIGNVFIALLAGVVGASFGQGAVFWLVPLFGLLAILATLRIRPQDINHRRARGFDAQPPPISHSSETDEKPEAWFRLLGRRDVAILALVAASFHFANAPMLNMVSQKLALAHPGEESALTATAVLIAQLSTIPASLLLARADLVGRKPFLIVALAALPVRGAIFALSDNAVVLLAAQVLDGVGAGLFDALLPLMLADAVRGSGRYTLARGLLGTIQGIGGSLSNVVSGGLIVAAGYNATFAILAGVGLLVLVAAWQSGIVARR